MKLTPEQVDQLTNEQVLGKKSKSIYDAYIKDFCEAKRDILFESFRALPLSAEQDLMEVKRMLYAIDTLEEEIVSQIQTGEMASKTLNEAERQEVH